MKNTSDARAFSKKTPRGREGRASFITETRDTCAGVAAVELRGSGGAGSRSGQSGQASGAPGAWFPPYPIGPTQALPATPHEGPRASCATQKP